MTFKLIAIRPILGTDSRFLKNLKPGVIYKFYQDYEFLDEDRVDISALEYSDNKINNEVDIVECKTKNSIIDNLYSGTEGPRINISAVVGKNGSGKSSLTELFFASIYLMRYRQFAKERNLLKNDITFKEFIQKNADSINKPFTYDDNHNDSFMKGINIFYEFTFRVDLFFEINNQEKKNGFYKLRIDNSDSSKKDFFEIVNLKNGKIVSDFDYFYTIVLNYSIHSLNSLEVGDWVASIFHKNDAYQTPLVINPKRERGNIDINTENELQQSRMLVNILDLEKGNKSRYFFNDKSITKIKFKLNFYKIRFIGEEWLRLDQALADKYGGYTGNINEVSSKWIDLVEKTFKLKKFNSCSWIEKIAYGYIIGKIDRIRKNYSFKFFEKDIDKENGIEEFLEKVKKDQTHITFKLRRTINFLQYNDNILKDKLSLIKADEIKDYFGDGYHYFELKEKYDDWLEVEYSEFDKVFSKNKGEIKKIDLINYLPPSFFDYEICFSNDENDTFNHLSSGEKQQIFSLHTIMYHTRNIASVQKDENIEVIRKYNHINIILDEIELYFHPEMQRQFIYRLISSLKHLNKYWTGNIKSFNILLATHSPFILSDIPSQNILRLDNGLPIKSDNQKTFGANTYNLLKNQFFLENGFLGEFAKKEIRKVYLELHYAKIERELGRFKEEGHSKEIKDNLTRIKDNISFEYNEIYGSSIKNKLGEILKNKIKYKEFIGIVGELIIKRELESLFNFVFNRSNQNEENIATIRQMLKDLGVNITDLKK